MLKVEVQSERLQAILRDLQTRGHDVLPALRNVMRDRLQNVLGEAKNKTPIARGYLRRSGKADARVLSDSVKGTVAFGGLAAAYAEVQHEADEFMHTLPPGTSRSTTKSGNKRKHPLKGYRGGQAHFLEGAGNSAWTGQDERLLSEALQAEAARALERLIMGAGGK